MRSKRKILAVLFTLFGLVPIVNDTYAIVGRPATPVSVAGAARRTVRRTAYY